MQTVTPYRVAGKPWSPNLGSHRAIVRVERAADAVLAHILWRRRDLHPERKDIVVLDRASGKPVRNRVAISVTDESGVIAFQPVTSPGEYEVYYLPFEQSRDWGLDAGRYRAPEDTAEHEWRHRHVRDWLSLPRAEVVAIECRTPFDDATPMGRIATAAEVAALLDRYPEDDYLLFPTPRELPIRMDDHLPVHWIETGSSDEFVREACRNEYFAFQVGVFAAREHVERLKIEFGDLRSANSSISAASFRCFNQSGTPISIEQGRVHALWFGIDIPADTAPGEYVGTLTIRPAKLPERPITIRLTIKPGTLSDRGDSEPWRHSRLRWLDSTIGSEDELVPPFTPVKVADRKVSILDRTLLIGTNGLPAQIRSRGRDILHAPIRFVVSTDGKSFGVPPSGGIRILPPEGGTPNNRTYVEWKSSATTVHVDFHCHARMEFDGFVGYEIGLKARRATDVENIRLEIPFRREIATYLMGMGHRGGKRPERWDWRWDQTRHQDSVWIGDVHAGLRIQLRDENYRQPLRVKYQMHPLNLPHSWHNEGRGGVTIREIGDDCVLFTADCGPRSLKAGEELRFDFTLLITPFKPLDTAKHFRTRHFHSDAPLEQAVAQGANNITIHHGTTPYPFINCPFLTADKLRARADEAHRRGLKLRAYHTVRELTNRVPELWALRSLGDEVFLKGDGGGHAWLQENLVKYYSPHWYHPFKNGDVDAAITESASSRWHNYWLEELRWLIENVGIDGIYIDDTNLDRVGMQRARRILERHRPGAIVDLHSNDMHWGFYGLPNTANVYMELLPYVDSLWFGESFDYTHTSPDFWLVEISGIPFGLMGETITTSLPPNPWRAALYGMHARLPTTDEHSPLPIFRVWDEFGIADAKMIGYWEKDCPVRTDHPDVLATAYVRERRALIALASWANEPVRVRLKMDCRRLGLNPKKARLCAPRIEHFQEAATFRLDQSILVPPGRGWTLTSGAEETYGCHTSASVSVRASPCGHRTRECCR